MDVRASEILSWPELRSGIQRLTRSLRQDRLLLFRHGETHYNLRGRLAGRHDTRLTQLGRAQAGALATELPQRVDLVVTSPLSRAIDTMTLAIAGLAPRPTPPLIDARLAEIDLGLLQGTRHRPIFDVSSGDLRFAPERGESYSALARRVFSSLLDLFGDLAAIGGPARTALVFCHAGVMRTAASLNCRDASPRTIMQRRFSHAECLELTARDIRLPACWLD